MQIRLCSVHQECKGCTCVMSQSTSSCSDSETSSPVTIWLMPSTLPVVENAQQEPHCTCMKILNRNMARLT